MRYYDKVFVIWDKQDDCIARLGGGFWSKQFGIYLRKCDISNSPRALKLLQDKKRYRIREIQIDTSCAYEIYYHKSR